VDHRINALQEITRRLRGGPGVIVKTIVRDENGRPAAIEERPFDAAALLKEGERLNGRLNAAGLEGDESIIYSAAMVDFCEAAMPHAPGSYGNLRRTMLDTRDALHEAGVRGI